MGQVHGRRGMAKERSGSRSDSSQELLAISTEGEGIIDSKTNYRSMESESDSLRYRSSESGPQSFGREEEGQGDDFINVQGLDPTAQALEQCERWVLRPYRILLKFLGWTPFTRDGDSYLLKILRTFLIVGWLVVICMAFVTQVLTCFRRDQFIPGNLTNVTIDGVLQTRSVIDCRQHLISSFILTDFLLLGSYLFGLYLFSHGETEYLSNLADKVFIKSAMARQGSSANWWLIGTILVFFVVGGVWILLSFAVRIMAAVTVDLFGDITVVEWSPTFILAGGVKKFLIAFSLVGFVAFDMVYVSAVMNYAAQSEMNIYLLRAIRRLVETKEYTEIDNAIKDILECRQYLRVLNGKTATATALILFNLGSLGILALITLDYISREPNIPDVVLGTVTAGLNSILWVGLVCFPFVQAARVTDACEKLKATGPEIRARPLQYINTPQIELDSYITLLRAVRLRATMFGVPIYPWFVYSILVAFTFTALVLFQTNTYSFSLYL